MIVKIKIYQKGDMLEPDEKINQMCELAAKNNYPLLNVAMEEIAVPTGAEIIGDSLYVTFRSTNDDKFIAAMKDGGLEKEIEIEALPS